MNTLLLLQNKGYILLLAVLFLSTKLISQCVNGGCGSNLVPNSGFEATTSFCAGSNGQLYTNQTPIQDWYGTACTTCAHNGITPDNFNSNCGGNTTINCGDGSGSVGFFTKSSGSNVREYVQTQLLAPLQMGHNYCISLKVRTTNANSRSNDGIGIWFNSVGMIDIDAMNGGNSFLGAGSMINATPQFDNAIGNLIDATCQTLTGTICATGGESWIVIGNFRTDANTSVGPGFGATGYLVIDELSIKENCSSTSFSTSISASSASVCSGSCTTLSVSATGGSSSSYTYSWSPISSTSNSVNVCPTSSTIYTVTTESSGVCGSILNTNTISINVQSCNVPLVATTTSVAVCSNSCGILSVVPSGGVGPYSYTWTPGNVNTPTINVCPTSTTIYTVLVSDFQNTVITPTVQVNVYNPIIISSTVTPAICTSATGAATLSVTGGTAPYSYLWNDGSSQSILDNQLPGTYSVVTTDANLCATTSTVNIAAVNNQLSINATHNQAYCSSSSRDLIIHSILGGTPNYTISEGGIALGTIVSFPYTLTPVSVGTHTYNINDANGCVNSHTVNIISTNSFVPVISSNPSLTLTCTDNTLVLSVSGGTVYSWSGPGITSSNTNSYVTVNAPGIYTVTLTNNNGCIGIGTVSITQNTITPSISMSTTGTINCISNTISVNATDVIGIYNWSGPGIISGVGTPTIGVNSSGVYNLTVTATNGCFLVTNINVLDNLVLPVFQIINPDSLTCNTNTVMLSSSINGTYFWSGPDIISSNQASNIVVNSSGIYSLTLTDQMNGCSSTVTTQVLQTSVSPTISVIIDMAVNAGDPVKITATGNAVNYNWNPTDGLSCVTCLDPMVNATKTTTYCIIGSRGTCTTQACVIFVAENCLKNKKFEVPNAFSPNGDGNNDEFCLLGWAGCVENFSVKIFSRWGEKLYESGDENFCWDGAYMGKLLEPSVYVFYIEAKNISTSERITKKGNITLIR